MRVFFCALFFLVGLSAESVCVTIHGYMRTHKSMHKMGNTLRSRGCIVYHFDYRSCEQSIEQSSAHLALFLESISANHPDTNIDFVTHSLGGIVLRSALNRIDCPPAAKRGKAVLLAPPNQGSRLAQKVSPCLKLFGKGAGRELARSQNFSRFGDFPDAMQIYVIAGTFGFNPLIAFPNDGKVALHETLLTTAHEFVKVSACHSLIMRNSCVIQLTIDFLEEKNAQ